MIFNFYPEDAQVFSSETLILVPVYLIRKYYIVSIITISKLFLRQITHIYNITYKNQHLTNYKIFITL
jgi:hypothetical protein